MYMMYVLDSIKNKRKKKLINKNKEERKLRSPCTKINKCSILKPISCARKEMF